MLHFENNPTIHLRRPVTVHSIAEALGLKPFELLSELIHMQVFVAPHQGVEDHTVHALGLRIGVIFRIDDDGGSSSIPLRSTGPISPNPLAGQNPHTDLSPMPQVLDSNDWKSIRFEGTDLPQSLMGISILIDVDDFTERTGDWIWKLPHCKGIEKSGPAQWCHDSAREIIDHMIENRASVIEMIQERLTPHGFDPVATFSEWTSSLMTIREIALDKEGDCHWIAELADFEPKAAGEKGLRVFDSLDSKRP